MAVIKRPPLIVPPDYNLRPPRAGEQAVAERAASEAARETLIGTPSSAAEGPEPSSTDSARAILTNGAGGGKASEAASAGENVLVSRTDRTVGNLDALGETRGENRVDNTLLRRLLAWTPEDRQPAATAGTGDGQEPDLDQAAVVQVVSRTQTLIATDADAAPANTE